MEYLKRVSLLLLIMLIIGGCNKKISKTEWTANDHLDYAVNLFEKGKYLKAQNELNFITIQYAGTPIMDKARLYLAKTYFKTKEYLVAISEFNRLIQEMPESQYISDAQYYIALCYEKLSPLPELDQSYTLKAIKEFQLFIETFPEDERVKEADKYIFRLRKKLGLKKLKTANLYKKNHHFNAAITYYDDVLENYYDLDIAEEAMFKKGECLLKLERYEESQEVFNAYLAKYPNGKYAANAKNNVEILQNLITNVTEESVPEKNDKR